MIAEQRSLIEDLAHSNQEYIRKFEILKLGIEGTAVEHEDGTSDIGAVEWEPSTKRRSLPGAPTRNLEKMNVATGRTPLQDKENTRGLGSRELATATMLPQAQAMMTRSLATSSNANTSNAFINTRVQTKFAMPPVQERGIPTTEAPTGFDQEVLFKQLEHYSMLIKNLLKEVDEAQYKITFKSRLRVKGGIAGLHESERQELEKMWGYTALQSAEQRLDSLVEGFVELPRMNSFAARDPVETFFPDHMRRKGAFPSMAASHGLERREQEEAALDEPRFYAKPVTGASAMEGHSNMPTSANEAAAKESRIIDASDDNSSERVAGAYTRDHSVPQSKYDSFPHKNYIKTSNSVPRASTENLKM